MCQDDIEMRKEKLEVRSVKILKFAPFLTSHFYFLPFPGCSLRTICF